MDIKKGSIICIECGSPAEESVKKYSKDIIKLTQCEKCGGYVDKYIEYDTVLILIDILLHKSQAYRHVLFNVNIEVTRQLSVLCVLCDTYMRWVTFHHMYLRDFPSTEDWHLILELNFYIMLGISTLEFLINIFVTAVIVSYANLSIRRTSSPPSFTSLLRILVISSFGKLLAVAALIWNKENSDAYLILIKIFVISSNAEAVKVISKRKFEEALAFVLCGVFSGYIVQDFAVWLMYKTWRV